MQSKNPFCYLFFQCDLLEDFLEKLADEMRKHPIWTGTVFFYAHVERLHTRSYNWRQNCCDNVLK